MCNVNGVAHRDKPTKKYHSAVHLSSSEHFSIFLLGAHALVHIAGHVNATVSKIWTTFLINPVNVLLQKGYCYMVCLSAYGSVL